MKKISEHYLFVVNSFLVAGLIGIGFWIQQSNAVITPASPPTPNAQVVSADSTTTASATPIAPTTALMVGQNTSTTPTSTVTALKKTTTTPPVIRRSHENESGERYRDE